MSGTRRSERLDGQTALVTGASSGIGADLARVLARLGASVILVARRAEALERLAAEIAPGLAVVRSVDLADETARLALQPDLAGVDILVNNAGFGVYGPFAETDWDGVRRMQEVDVVALMHLTHLALPGMLSRRRGRVLNVASIAGFQPTPLYAAYGAGKAQVVSFGMGLNHELRGSGVTCTTLCPGVTATEFFDVARQPMNRFQRRSVMSSQAVAEIGIKACLAGLPVAVAGRLNAVTASLGRLFPLSLSTRLAGAAMASD